MKHAYTCAPADWALLTGAALLLLAAVRHRTRGR